MKRKRKRTVKGDYLRIGNLDLAPTGLHIGTICYTGVLLVLASSSVVVACPFVTHQSTGTGSPATVSTYLPGGLYAESEPKLGRRTRSRLDLGRLLRAPLGPPTHPDLRAHLLPSHRTHERSRPSWKLRQRHIHIQ